MGKFATQVTQGLGSLFLGTALLLTVAIPVGAQLQKGLFGASKVEVIEGSLDETDPRYPSDSSYYDRIPLRLNAGQILVASLFSKDLDPFLLVLNGEEQLIWDDDDAGYADSALLAVRISATGDYSLHANTYAANQIGSYTVHYMTIPEPKWAEVIEGDLGPGDEYHPGDQTWMDVYTVTGKEGQILLVEMTSDEFDAYLQILDTQGNVVSQGDDQAGGTDPLAILALEETGSYTIRANTYSGAVPGAYTLKYVMQ